jgi:thermostable 8-oxoguanine DNA glycosylase
MKKHYDGLYELIKGNLNTPETQEAKELIKKLGDFRSKGFLSKDQFYAVAMWKTPRPKNHYLSNSEGKIIGVSKSLLNSKNDDEKINLLMSLKGVSVPVASALLTIINPKNYGIIDIRVWQLLYLYREVKTKPEGQGFSLKNYKEYLSILRKYARQFNVGVRDIERVLFFYHKKIQEGRLYK